MSVLQRLDLNELNRWESTLGGRVSIVSVKPGSHMPMKYLRCSRGYFPWYYSGLWGHNATSNKKHCSHACEVKLESTSQASRRKDWHGLCYWRLLFSYRNSITGGTSSYSYCMSQVVWQHMRTRLQPAQLMKINFWLSLSANQHWNPSWVIGFE